LEISVADPTSQFSNVTSTKESEAQKKSETPFVPFVPTAPLSENPEAVEAK
jgi:hypothetical protein